MARAPRDWKDVRLFNLQINYDADPDVATFIYRYKDGSLSKLIKMLIRQHMTTTGDPALSLEYCRRTRTNALLDSIQRDGGLEADEAIGEPALDPNRGGQIPGPAADSQILQPDNPTAEVRLTSPYSGPNESVIRAFDSA
ncbi:hypothetical protein ACN8ZM_40280 (plasmid) [Burkholderia aenigmatica]|uniref:hypothetical protein n=1 Tax=Burkholderia aenigmatica TaxID=2015348 RepID=UPI003B4328A6